MKNNRKNRKKWRMKARTHFKELVQLGRISRFEISKKIAFDPWPWPCGLFNDEYYYKMLPVLIVKCWSPLGELIEMDYMPYLPEGCE